MPSSSSTSCTTVKIGLPTSRTSRIQHSNDCHTCRIRVKTCRGIEDGQTSCNNCLQLNIQCLGTARDRPDWLCNSNAREEIKRRIQHHLNQYPVPRGLDPHPERPYLDFTDLTEKDSRRNQSQEEHDQPAGIDQPQQLSPASLPSSTEYPSQAPSPSSSEPRGLSYYPGGTMNPGGMINQGIFYNHESAADHNPYLPQNVSRFRVPHIRGRSICGSAYPQAAPQLLTGQLPSQTETRPNTEHVKSWYTAYLAGFERWHSKVAPEGRKGVYEWDAQVQSLVWFQTEPFTKQMLSRTKSVQLVTKLDYDSSTADQSAGWFELQVARPVEDDPTFAKVKRRPNGDEVSWCSHKNTDAATTQPQGLVERKGTVFGPDHELWSQIGDGDVIQVVVKAPVHTTSETASNGALRISTWWEPSSEMMLLIDKSV